MSVLILCVAFLVPTAHMFLTMARDSADDRTARDIARIHAGLAALPRDSLLPLDWHETWPKRQTPSDSPRRLALIVGSDRTYLRPGAFQ